MLWNKFSSANTWFFTSILSLVLLAGCTSKDVVGSDEKTTSKGNGNTDKTGWLIPEHKVMDGGPGKDGIPSIDNPHFGLVENTTWLEPDDLVIGVSINGKKRAYPHAILNWHEIVNDKINRLPFCVTYCPLTGTAIVWERILNGKPTTYGVSGLLYQNNLIPYDRLTDSYWSQMLNMGVKGAHRGTKADVLNVIETKWSTWKKAYPNSRVLTRQTGYDRDYETYPYGNYKERDDLFLFPVDNKDDRLPNKARVHGIEIDSSYVVYPIQSFGGEIKVLNHQFNGQKLVTFGSSKDNIVETYYRTIKGKTLKFEAVQGEYPVVMEDQQGNRWTIFGKAVSGPLKGTQLISPNSYNGFWFAFVDFFPDLELRGR